MRRTAFYFVALILAWSTTALAYRTSAWVSAWDPVALASIQAHGGKLTEANPGWYSLAADGSIAKNYNAENSTWRAAMSGMDLIPTIKNYVNAIGGFDGGLVAAIVNDPARREAHAEAITQLVVSQAFDGIDIDYEALPASARAGFTSFLTVLSNKLHGAGKKLSVTVHAKTSDSQNWDGPGAQDFVQIGRLADTVKIMAYDKHWSTSYAGAITPLDWLESVTAYAVSSMPANRVMVGLPWYGYDWLANNGKSVTYKQAMDIATANGVTVGRDANGEATFSYSGRKVFFQDAESYRRKADLLVQKFPGIAGFAHWRTGAEDPAIWERVGQLRGGTSTDGSGATPLPPADFAISGPDTIDVEAGRIATGSYSIVPFYNFAATVTGTAEKIDPFSGTASFAAPLRVGTPAELRLNVDASTAPGLYRLKLRFSTDSITREIYIGVNVKAAPLQGDFTISGLDELTVATGRTASAFYRMNPTGGFDQTASVTAEMFDVFAGTVGLTLTSIAPNGVTELQVKADGNAVPGSYRVRLRFTAGVIREQIVVVKIVSSRSRGTRR